MSAKIKILLASSIVLSPSLSLCNSNGSIALSNIQPIISANDTSENDIIISYQTQNDIYSEYAINKAKNKEIIKSLLTLKNNWNGYSGKTFGKRLKQKFLKIIDSLPIQPIVGATGRKSLVLDYEINDNEGISFEIFKDKVTFAYVNFQFPEKCFEEQVPENKIADILKKYYEQ